MPVITAEGESAVVTAWFVDEGGMCESGALIAEVQAEKVSLDVTAPAAGFVVDRIGINDPVDQGSPICRIVAEAPVRAEVRPASPGPTEAGAGSPPASPAARRLARELGVNLAFVAGSGPGGRITEQDVRTAEIQPDSGVSEMTPMRQAIARHMRASVAETAAVTLFTTVRPSADPDRITAMVVRAVAGLVPRYPGLNGHREGDRLVSEPVAHVSVAIQTSEGLVAPVVRDPASRTEEQVASEIRELARRAFDKTLTAADFAGGTFSVTNLGGLGVEGFTPIINLPEVAILGVGAIRSVPVVDDAGEVVAGREMTLSLTFDHAFVDGGPAASFLKQLAAVLSE